VTVLVRPRFYDDIAEEVYWLLEKAGSEVAEHWHESVWQTVELLKTGGSPRRLPNPRPPPDTIRLPVGIPSGWPPSAGEGTSPRL